MLTRNFLAEVPKVKYNQKEVGTYLMLHAKHACNSGIQNFLVIKEDGYC